MFARTLKGYARLNVRIGLDFPHSVKQYVPAEFDDSFLRHGPLPRDYAAAISWRGVWKGVGVGRGSAEQLKGILQFSHYAPQGLEGVK